MLNPENLDWPLIGSRVCGLLYAYCCLGLNLVRQFDKAGYSGFTQAAAAAGGPCSNPTTLPSPIRLDGQPRAKVWLGLVVCSIFLYEAVLHRHREQRREIMHQLAGQ